MHRFCLALALALLAVASSARPVCADPPEKREVRMMLSGFESMPDKAHWRKLGPETLVVLVDLYDDTAQPPYVRLRAVNAAGHYPLPATRTFLRAVARTPGQSDLFVREAVLALGRAFGDAAVDDISPFLDRRQPVVREAAARALARIGNAPAKRLLRERLGVERERVVRDAIERGLAR